MAYDDHITITPEPRRMRARFNGGILADSTATLRLAEKGLPDRIYFPPGDVETGYLSPTQRSTACGYKGLCGYFTVEYDGQVAENAVWSYADAKPEVRDITGYLAFDEGKGFDIYTVDD